MAILKVEKPKQVIPKSIILAAVGITCILTHIYSIPCFWQILFHIPCPGCGMSRAYLALFQGDIAGAFQYHLAFWSIPFLILYFIFDGKIFGKRFDIPFLCIIGVLFLATWIIHLTTGFC